MMSAAMIPSKTIPAPTPTPAPTATDFGLEVLLGVGEDVALGVETVVGFGRMLVGVVLVLSVEEVVEDLVEICKDPIVEELVPANPIVVSSYASPFNR